MAKKRARKNTQPSSSTINDRDANDANWKGIDFESQDYGEEEEYIDDTPIVDIVSDESDKEDIPKRMPKKRKIMAQAELRRRINPARRGEGKKTAPCWVAFEIEWIREEDEVERKYAECNYCLRLLKADGGRNGTC
ncbi:hypothetical protein LXL04_021527 [Taraxacum kok-saghyz]